MLLCHSEEGFLVLLRVAFDCEGILPPVAQLRSSLNLCLPVFLP